MPDLTPEEIERLLELEAKATPGPWSQGNPGDCDSDLMVYCDDVTGQRIADCTNDYTSHSITEKRANAALIAAARNLARPLAERVRELEAENARLVAHLSRALGFMDGTALAIEMSEEVQIGTVADNLRREAENIRDRASLCAEIEAETIERCARLAELPPITDTILDGDTLDYVAAAIRAGKP